MSLAPPRFVAVEAFGARRQRTGLALAGLAAVILHLGAIAALVAWRSAAAPGPPGEQAIAIDLAPALVEAPAVAPDEASRPEGIRADTSTIAPAETEIARAPVAEPVPPAPAEVAAVSPPAAEPVPPPSPAAEPEPAGEVGPAEASPPAAPARAAAVADAAPPPDAVAEVAATPAEPVEAPAAEPDAPLVAADVPSAATVDAREATPARTAEGRPPARSESVRRQPARPRQERAIEPARPAPERARATRETAPPGVVGAIGSRASQGLSSRQDTAGRAAAADPDALRRYAAELAAALKRRLRYPDAAREAGIRGTATLRFTLDRSGRILSASLLRSAGSAALDQAALATVAPGTSLPAAPDGLPQQQLTISVPLRFEIR